MSEPGPPVRPPATSGARRRAPLPVVFSITLTGILANTLIVAPLPDIVDYFGVGDAAAGLLVAAGSLPGIVVAPLVGLGADRFGRRAVVVVCLVVFGVAGLAAAAAPTFALLVAARLAQGIGSAGLINLAVVLLADGWEGTARARVIGQNSAVLTISIAVLPFLGGWLAEAGGWRWSFVPYGLALVTAVAAWLTVPDPPRPTEPVALRQQVDDALHVLRRPRVAAAVAFGGVLFVLIFGLFLTALPLLLEERFGLGPRDRGLVLAAPAIGSTVVALSLGRLRPRLGARRLLLAGTGAFAVAFAVMGWAPLLVLLLAGAVLYGLGEGATIPTVQDLVAGAAPPESRAAVVAAWVGTARLGQTVGPLATGAALGPLGPEGVFLLGAAASAALLALQVVAPRRASLR